MLLLFINTSVLLGQSKVITFEFDRDVRLYEEISSMKNSELYDSVEIVYDLKDSVLNCPKELKKLLDQKVNDWVLNLSSEIRPTLFGFVYYY